MKKTGFRLIALLSAMLLMFSVFALPTFAEDTADTAKKGLSGQAIAWIVVAGLIVVAIAVLMLKFRDKVQKFLRVYKSEFKKISWLNWEQTKKSTLVVLVVLIACAAVICLLDFALSKGFLAFLDLFK